jgi:hypothetical protein
VVSRGERERELCVVACERERATQGLFVSAYNLARLYNPNGYQTG